MKLQVEILRAEQSWDLKTRAQQNYLVIQVLGLETRIPCSEEQMMHVVAEIGRAEQDQDEMLEQAPELDENESVAAPSTFQMPTERFAEPTEFTPAPPQRLAAAPSRKLAPVTRPRGDDVGIAQG